MRRKANRLKVVLTVVNIILIVFFLLSAIVMLIPAAFNQISKQERPILGNYLYINNNNNLTPVMKKNDLVVVKPMPITQLALGDFLCYYSAEDPEKNALFGKIVGFSDAELDLSDKAGHSTVVRVDDIVVMGKATNTIIALGDIIIFFHTPSNRRLFYIVVGAAAFVLVGLTVLLHVLQNSRSAALEPVPPAFSVTYKLDELIQVEEGPIDFEKAPAERELLHQ